jgi:hypothetical protein
VLYARRQSYSSHTVQLVHFHVIGFPNGMSEKISYEDAVTQLYNLEGSSKGKAIPVTGREGP